MHLSPLSVGKSINNVSHNMKMLVRISNLRKQNVLAYPETVPAPEMKKKGRQRKIFESNGIPSTF